MPRRHSLYRQDVAWSVSGSFLATLHLLQVWRHLPLPLLLLNTIAGPVTGAAVAALILGWHWLYEEHRTNLLTAVKLLRVASVSVTVNLEGDALADGWHTLHSNSSFLWLAPFWKGLVLCLTALGFQLPMHRNWWVHGLALGALLAAPKRCAVEQRLPELRELSTRLASRLGAIHGRAFPLVLQRPRRLGRDPCVMMHGWSLLALGYVLPCLILDWSEQQRLVGSQRCPLKPNMRSASVLLSYLGLFAASSLVAWQAVDQAVGLAARFWPA